MLCDPTVHRYSVCTVFYGIPQYIGTISAYYALWDPIVRVHRYNQCVLCIMGPHSTQYALILPVTQELWPEDGLKKDRIMLP